MKRSKRSKTVQIGQFVLRGSVGPKSPKCLKALDIWTTLWTGGGLVDET